MCLFKDASMSNRSPIIVCFQVQQSQGDNEALRTTVARLKEELSAARRDVERAAHEAKEAVTRLGEEHR